MTTSPPIQPEPDASSIQAARQLVADLIANGVCEFVLCPGSRSAPIAYALADAEQAGLLRLHVRIDERSAGFLALGLAKASGLPVAIAMTSGTAVANLHPAILEAHHSQVPLVALTADRPHELRGTGASQTTDQVGLFGLTVRFAADVPAPTGRATEMRDLSTVVARAISAAQGVRTGYPGPVHLNLAYREPLYPRIGPGPVDATGASDGSLGAGDGAIAEVRSCDFAQDDITGVIDRDRGAFDVSSLDRHRPRVIPSRVVHEADPHLPGDPARTVVVAGDGAGPNAGLLAAAQGWPLFAEPSSGATSPTSVTGYAALLNLPEFAPTAAIHQVMVFGHPTLSRSVDRLLARPDVAVTVVAPGSGPWNDATRNAALVIQGLDPRWYQPIGGEASSFLNDWLAASSSATDLLKELTGVDKRRPLSEVDFASLSVARALVQATGANDALVVGSSNSIRDLDLVSGLDPMPGRMFANRGLAGIDGTVSTAMGVALVAADTTRALLGDLTALHDVGGLWRNPLEPAAQLQIVVLNDDGGGIFHTLEHGSLGASSTAAAHKFERVFGTPHQVDLAAICAGYGVIHHSIRTLEQLSSALASPGPEVELLEVVVPRSTRNSWAEKISHQLEACLRRTN